MATPTLTKASPSLVFGVGQWNTDPANLPKQQELISTCRKYNVKIFDTARSYGGGESEKFLGSQGLADSGEFEIMTKASMCLHDPKGSTKDGILAGWNESSEALKTEKVSIYLLHVPDETTPVSETMEGIQALYEAGHFTSFGLSNFSPSQVEEIYDYASSKKYILPTIYQSVYSLCSRRNEAELFPLLHKLNIKIQAYSAIGSGFLVKSPSEVQAGKGNFDPSTVLGKILHDMYGKPSYLEFLRKYRELVEEAGESPAGLAYRWITWNSGLDLERGDQVVLGASSANQLENTILEIEKGPLEKWVVERLDGMWKEVEKEAPGDNFETFKKLMAAGVL